jgi:hypothetical protein
VLFCAVLCCAVLNPLLVVSAVLSLFCALRCFALFLLCPGAVLDDCLLPL